MKLKKLKLLSKFRGLPKGYEINFSNHKNDELAINPICFIGLNGSGKSNLLELISEVFYYLENFNRASTKELGRLKTSFGFEIEYSQSKITLYENGFYLSDLAKELIDDKDVIKIVSINKKPDELPEFKVSFDANKRKIKLEDEAQIFAVLPRYVLGYSSGMNELLSNPFIKMDFDYLKEINQKTTEAKRSTLEINRLFYLNYNSSKLVTICNLIFDLENIKSFKDELQIKKLNSFSINIKQEKTKDNRDYFPSELNLAINTFQSLDPFFDKKEKTSLKYKDIVEYHFNFTLNSAVIEGFKNEFKTPINLFRILYNFQILNLDLVGRKTVNRIKNTSAKSKNNLSDLIPKKEKDQLVFSIDSIALKKEKVKDSVYFKQLSDGEHQMLQVLGSIALFNNKSTLFLLDEPTTHFNPEWRSKFIYLMNQSVGEDEREQEVLLTTHSPFIVSDSKKENVIRTINGNKKTFEYPSEETYGASVRILLSKLFNQKKSIGEFSYGDLFKLYEKVNSIKNEEDIQFIKDESLKFGDSPEKIMLFHLLSQKIKSF
ncbi:restriction system-associated AAA family ATPase [uncultured Psychroserpens sp.]|uniref:restriction system-associated AAA family ATPase n=1 Tax=uncultured Psychroserpens sp. TaxID=255436 RepID=UPI0026217CB2|nr:restriction system-associated AAA family ATPase [uncultured Psychroserpens sp.]